LSYEHAIRLQRYSCLQPATVAKDEKRPAIYCKVILRRVRVTIVVSGKTIGITYMSVYL